MDPLHPDENREAALARSIRDALIKYPMADYGRIADAVVVLLWVEGYQIIPRDRG